MFSILLIFIVGISSSKADRINNDLTCEICVDIVTDIGNYNYSTGKEITFHWYILRWIHYWWNNRTGNSGLLQSNLHSKFPLRKSSISRLSSDTGPTDPGIWPNLLWLPLQQRSRNHWEYCSWEFESKWDLYKFRTLSIILKIT